MTHFRRKDPGECSCCSRQAVYRVVDCPDFLLCAECETHEPRYEVISLVNEAGIPDTSEGLPQRS